MDDVLLYAVNTIVSIGVGLFIHDPLKRIFDSKYSAQKVKTAQKNLAKKLKVQMPELLTEMKLDLQGNPLNRDFVIMSKGWTYNGKTVAYYFETHENLKEKMTVLENHGLVQNITYNNVDRYRMSEELVEIIENFF